MQIVAIVARAQSALSMFRLALLSAAECCDVAALPHVQENVALFASLAGRCLINLKKSDNEFRALKDSVSALTALLDEVDHSAASAYQRTTLMLLQNAKLNSSSNTRINMANFANESRQLKAILGRKWQ